MNPPTSLAVPALALARSIPLTGAAFPWEEREGGSLGALPGDAVWFQRQSTSELTTQDRQWPGCCRSICQGVLERCAANEEVERARQVASELVTNALAHGDATRPIRMGVWCQRTVVRIDVTSFSLPWSPPPIEGALDPDRESGRGLWLVGMYADDWGITSTADRTTVWCDLYRTRSAKAAS
ncbi:ATP-binding protein [Streptomyces sp. TLI_146]|uniref:ATP-binding protein n=1 Tax=Streptomyces sp. TLI_146 TaxID=1938858 RepID=UPI000CBADA6C|nr:ATP-binding protein [Streptomyces sp. TLI_146]PKV82683.1 histidine kinase-like protein [Streptomyces sp. TLI_146]